MSEKHRSHKTDEELVVSMNLGDQGAFEELYDRYSIPIYNFFLSKLRNKEKAEDFLQNLFMKLLQKGKSFDSSKKFSTWFYTIAHNQCKNEFRNQSRAAVQDENFDLNSIVYNWDSSSEKMDSSIFSEHLTIALHKLGSDHHSSFILRFKHQFSIKEISEVMDCSEGTTKSRLFYSLKKLAAELKQFNPYSI